jgi:hypothetical protein
VAIVYSCSITVDAGELESVVAIFAGRIGYFDLNVRSIFQFILDEGWSAVPEETVGSYLRVPGQKSYREHSESQLQQLFEHDMYIWNALRIK